MRLFDSIVKCSETVFSIKKLDNAEPNYFKKQVNLWEDNSESKDEDSCCFICNNSTKTDQKTSTSKPAQNSPAQPSAPENTGSTPVSDNLETTVQKLFNNICDGNRLASFNTENNKLNNKDVDSVSTSDILSKLNDMLKSTDPQTKAFAEALQKAIDSIDLPDNLKKQSSNEYLIDYNYSSKAIIIETLINKIKNKPGQSSTSSVLKSKLNIDDLVNLDKNGDGNFIDELNEIINSSDFKNSAQSEINTKSTCLKLQSLDDDNNKLLSEDEITKHANDNDIAKIILGRDGKADRALLLALGGEKDKSGNVTISPSTLLLLDLNGDGIITKEEVDKFKQGETYQKYANSRR